MAQATEDSTHRSLSQEQIDHFRQRGFAVVGKVLEADELRELQDEYDRVFSEARRTAQMRNLASSDGSATTEADEEMLQIMQMCERSILFRRLLYDKRILDCAEDLIGPNLQLFHDQALFKPAHCGGPVHWHQDNGYWECTPANIVSCWMTLDDVDVHNGAMHVIPGSHLQPVEHVRDEKTPLYNLEDKVDASAAEIIDLPAGGIMFHHCQMLHHTPPNRTDRQRRAFAIHLMNPGTRSGDGSHMEVSFSRPMLRMRLTEATDG
jgi:ectoine hydroxylase-related dioxygenase (phytanoyl-CoA dioxygenase family)